MEAMHERVRERFVTSLKKMNILSLESSASAISSQSTIYELVHTMYIYINISLPLRLLSTVPQRL